MVLPNQMDKKDLLVNYNLRKAVSGRKQHGPISIERGDLPILVVFVKEKDNTDSED